MWGFLGPKKDLKFGQKMRDIFEQIKGGCSLIKNVRLKKRQTGPFRSFESVFNGCAAMRFEESL